jgi:group I intron endonuclease
MSIGIYAITHPKAKGAYVGQAANFERRWERHRDDLANQSHCNDKLQEIADRYGIKGFRFKVLEECDRGALDHLEMKWIASQGTWNIRPNQQQAKAALGKGRTMHSSYLFPGWIRFLFVMGCGWLVAQFFGWMGAVVGIVLGFIVVGVS